MITQLSQFDMNGTYSYADYLTWRIEETVELIRGNISVMLEAPSEKHQTVVSNLGNRISLHFQKPSCKLFYAPSDVKLYDLSKSKLSDREVFNVVQPDLCVTCDNRKFSKQGSVGSPDWIIEVLTLGDNSKDVRLKFDLYAEYGIREYWIIHPYSEAVHQFVLDQSAEKYQLHAMHPGDEIATPYLFPDLQIDLNDVFAE